MIKSQLTAVTYHERGLENFPFAPEYQVSTHGRVRKGKKIKKLTRNQGYRYTDIRGTSTRVNRIVGETFLAENRRPWTPIVDHIDQDKLNNNVNNLRWTSHTVNGLNSVKQKGYFKRPNGTFQVQQKLFGKPCNHGTYKTEAEAKKAADKLRAETIDNLTAIEEMLCSITADL